MVRGFAVLVALVGLNACSFEETANRSGLTDPETCDCATEENCSDEEILACDDNSVCPCDAGMVCVDDICVADNAPVGCFDGADSTIPVAIAGNVATTDHQVSVSLDTQGLIDAGFLDVNCENLRFVTDSGDSIPHWQNGDCSLGEFWVRVPSLEGDQQENLVYALLSSDTASQSDGAATFVFFDDFTDFADEWSVSTENEQPGLEESGVENQDGIISINAQASCNIGPADGLDVSISRELTMPEDETELCFDIVGSIRVDGQDGGVGARGGVGFRLSNGGAPISESVEASCAGAGCSIESPFEPSSNAVANSFRVTLTTRAGECTTSAGEFQDLRVRKCFAENPFDEPQADAGEVVECGDLT